MADAEKIEQMVKAFRYIALADRTTYEHHEKRPRDGKRPEEIGGTIWLTPEEAKAACTTLVRSLLAAGNGGDHR